MRFHDENPLFWGTVERLAQQNLSAEAKPGGALLGAVRIPKAGGAIRLRDGEMASSPVETCAVRRAEADDYVPCVRMQGGGGKRRTAD